MSRPRTMVIELASTPPVGLAINMNGQRFELIGHEPYRNRAGEMTTLLVWQGEYATCGEGFVNRTMSTRWAEVRRCKLHRQPGMSVSMAPAAGRASPEISAPNDDLADIENEGTHR